MLALPLFRGAVPRLFALSRKVTRPVGVPAPGAHGCYGGGESQRVAKNRRTGGGRNRRKRAGLIYCLD